MREDKIGFILEEQEKPFIFVEKAAYLPQNFKSTASIGNIHINLCRKFNWLQIKMIKFFFGLDIVNMDDAD